MPVKNKKIALVIAIASVLVVTYQMSFPSTQYFECKVGEYGMEWEETKEGKKKDIPSYYGFSEYLTVKKYMYGMFYTIDNYEIKECQRMEDNLLCGRNDDYINLRMINGEMSQTKKYVDKKNYKSGWKCERIERLVK